MTFEEFQASLLPNHVRFWADGKELGETFFTSTDHRFPAASEYFYCQVCNEVWGKIEFMNRGFSAINVTCRNHRDERSEYYLPGSMFTGFALDDLFDVLTPELIAREFWLHLEAAEKEI